MSDVASAKRAQGAGSFEFIRGHWYVRVSMPDGTRPRTRLCDELSCKCATMTEARRMEVGAAISERERARGKADLAASVAKLGPKDTLRQFGERWTNGDLHKRWPDHVSLKRTAKQDGQRLELHVYPAVENVAVADFRLEDAELVMSRLPPELSSATRRHVAQLMHRLMALAVYPARIRQANPLPKGFMPRVRRTKAFHIRTRRRRRSWSATNRRDLSNVSTSAFSRAKACARARRSVSTGLTST